MRKMWKILFGLFWYIISTQANPILGLFDPKCKIEYDDACPHRDVGFWLFTRDIRENPLKLNASDLHASDFAFKERNLYILLHGYTGDRDYSPNVYVRPALLDTEDAYIISVDYGRLVPYPCYMTAVENLRVVAKCLGQLINNLVEEDLVENDKIHIIGFSLGAQVAGQTANYLKRKLKRITGLDPAKPLFAFASSEYKLDSSDAEFVDVIHTDVAGRGMLASLGHVDFYPNLGTIQPGCDNENPKDPGSCNHDRAPQYYAESVRNPNGFWSYSCRSWLYQMFDLCNDRKKVQRMGHRSLLAAIDVSDSSLSPFLLDPLSLNESVSLFRPRLPLKIILHGYNQNRDLSPNREIRPPLLYHEQVYVISLDYSVYTKHPCYYPWTVYSAAIIAKCLANFIDDLIARDYFARNDIHLIGFSFGAQVAGLTANYVKEKLNRITALDPARPGFMTTNLSEKLDSTDADFIDVIHTDPMFFSYLNPSGHADFYPNLEDFHQPGCPIWPFLRVCNHYRAPAYYAESIYSTEGFWSYNCGNWSYYLTHQCYLYDDIAMEQMGYHLAHSARGSYFLSTNRQPPYAQGQLIQTELNTVDGA
uniref:Lipase domain-containing protein n=1 Tax=Glossina pallidipes TaxID=7398 RepID=A0A1A9ZN29_GLOPL